MDKYQSYKPSGVEWIHDIPEHWNIMRIKYLFKSIVVKSIDGGEELLSVSEKKGIIPRREIRDENEELTRSETLEGYLLVKKGDLVNNIMLMWKRGLGVSNYDGIVSPSYSVFRINEPNNSKYWDYLLRTDLYVSEFRRNSTGIIDSRLRLYDDSFGDIYSILPPIPEQNQIVQFLSEKTDIIDTLISTKERKIELLKEQRVSLISHVITKGLDPKVKMKESGIEWIGEIPEHWIIRRVSNLGVFFKGSGIRKDEVKDDGIPCIRYGEIYTNYNRVVYEPISFIDEETSKSSVLIRKGDVLFTGSGETMEDIGKTIVYYGEKDVFVGGDIIVLRLNKGLNPLFISYLMNTNFVQYQKSLSGRGEIIVHIYSKNIKEILIPLPPKDEQQQIVEHLDIQTKEIDDLVSMEQKKIDLLKEFRQSLISEVITGKFDVRTNVN